MKLDGWEVSILTDVVGWEWSVSHPTYGGARGWSLTLKRANQAVQNAISERLRLVKLMRDAEG